MANHRSAQKRARQTIKRTERNIWWRSRTKTAIKKFNKILASGNMELAKNAMDDATQLLQKAASKGVFHANNAARRVSRLVLSFNKSGKAS